MTSTQSKVPQLRFPEFSGEWKSHKLSEYIQVRKGGASLKPSDFVEDSVCQVIPKKAIVYGGLLTLDNKRPTFCSEDFFASNQTSVVDNEYLLTTLRDLVPSAPSLGLIVANSNKEKLLMAQGVYGFKVSSGLSGGFLCDLSNTTKYRRLMYKMCVGSTQVHMRSSEFFEFSFNVPDIEEQNRIDFFLSCIDKKTNILKQKHEYLIRYKKSLMQQLFSQQLRFKDDNGQDFPDWDVKALSSIAKKVSTKNKDDSVKSVLTNSAKHGIVNQLDYFDKDIANENNLTNYCVVEKNDFVYNPRISVHAPVGPIKRNHICKGVMSPLYTVFRFKDVELLDFVEIFFGTTFWHRYMNSIANFGARHDRMNITSGDFFALPIKVPCVEERIKLVGFVKYIDKKINLAQQQIEQTQVYKQGLLQQMFV